MNNNVVEINGFTKYFGGNCVVDHVSFSIPQGSIFALLGRNGSGKSTIIKMLLGMLKPTYGSATIYGCSSANLTNEIRSRIGYLAEGHPLYMWMSVKEICHFQAKFYPKWNRKLCAEICDYFRLQPKTKVGKLSRGERAGLSLALTLAAQPDLFIFDDPMLGLDPVASHSFLEMMVYIAENHKCSVLFSSHMLSGVERIADYIAIVDKGVLRVNCSLDVFHSRIKQISVHFPQSLPEMDAFEKIPGVLRGIRDQQCIVLTVANYNAEMQKKIEDLGGVDINCNDMSLEDAFIDYLGRKGMRDFNISDLGATTQ
ncbi:ABC transporter ATP-binding protein [Candidatus Uabimicrobium amorphum]|uniref:Multidrug ABC transporter ATP-binding protein n=1 Tax=Uabimicrobium amorphum TaxID=2596890 RepID=A0A5S9IS69_UABAM|nr:ABC transporter ATP-binding protein [Candidatus Uabimicrobium amorphum]BBM87173.1 multidrug ABC transporter ATP-binding protein [Candidatus Uabimicrobium amorphum]